jgi:hypothetical protein
VERRRLLEVQWFHDQNADAYDRWLAAYRRALVFDVRRDRLTSRAQGRTLEVGVGTGRNIGA